ncbi:glycosyltransferase family 39 protein [Amnibacterium kyonggiense]|nr:glycosyltransferase family 39 protein [Amnibacterium kyonggiense]
MSTTAAPLRRPRIRARGAAAPLLVGLAAAGIAGVQVGRPAPWRDEVASIAMAQRDWGPFWATIAHVDAVHALYYAGLHLWFAVVPYSPTTLRLPSVAAAAGTAALLVVLGRRLAGPRAGIAAGALSAVLPAMIWAGGEGRSSALTALLATAATLALLHALETDRRRALAWAASSALLALTIAVFVDAALLALAHLATVLLIGRGRRAAGAVAVVAGVLPAAPLLLVARGQTGQVDWIAQLGQPPLVPDGVVQQWFRADAIAIAWGVALLVGAASAVLRRRPASRLAAVALPWVVLPPVLLAAPALVGDPLYWPRYVTFTAPAVALLVGAAVAALPLPAAVSVALALALVAVPQERADRQPRAKAASTLQDEARLVERSRSPGDGPSGIVYGQQDRVEGLTTRAAAIADPAPFRGLEDLIARVPLERSTDLFGEDTTTAAAVPKTAHLRTVWVLIDPGSRPATAVPAAGMRALGFTETGRFRAPGALLLRWTR